MSVKLSIAAFLVFLSVVCKAQEYIIKKDTLRPVITECIGEMRVIGYRNVQGIKISMFYKIIDSLSIDFNGDNKQDKILILSPITEEDRDTLPCLMNRKKRLLITLVSSEKEKYRIGFVNPDVLLNNYDYMSNPLRHMRKIKNGFRLTFEFGSVIDCNYNFDFVAKNGKLLLNKRDYYCFNKTNPALEKRQTTFYAKKNLSLSALNINTLLEPIPDLLEK